MLKTTFVILGVVGTATAEGHLKKVECNLCDAGEEFESTKTHGVCTADSRYAEDECFSCMESDKAGKALKACTECVGVAGKAFCASVMGEATCSTNTGTFKCDVGTADKVTNAANCPYASAELHAYCSEVMGEPYCMADPKDSFICDDGIKALGGKEGGDWTKCPRKKGTIDKKDPSCKGCIEKTVLEPKNWYVQGCYDCFNEKDASGNKPTNNAWCAEIMGTPTCNTNTVKFVCDSGSTPKVTNTTSCPVQRVIPAQNYKWCVSLYVMRLS